VNKIRTLKQFKDHQSDIVTRCRELYPNKDCEKAVIDFVAYCETKKHGYVNLELAFFNWVRRDSFNQYNKKQTYYRKEFVEEVEEPADPAKAAEVARVREELRRKFGLK
jgi:hypothetical protein